MKDFVPSIGSTIQRNPLVPDRSGNSSPRMASSGKRALIRARSSSSAPRSAIVTGESSAFNSTARSLREKYSSVNCPASRAAANARSSRAVNSSGPQASPGGGVADGSCINASVATRLPPAKPSHGTKRPGRRQILGQDLDFSAAGRRVAKRRLGRHTSGGAGRSVQFGGNRMRVQQV